MPLSFTLPFPTQPHKIDYPKDGLSLPETENGELRHLFSAIDQEFSELYADLKRLRDQLNAAGLVSGTSAGKAGIQGIPGQDGVDGEDGPIGPPGQAGLPGVTGPQGIVGPAGDDGQDGDIGLVGPIGPAGPSGLPVGFLFDDSNVEDQIWVPPTLFNPSQVIVTTTGSINTLNPGTTFIVMNNASLTTIAGLAAGYPGQEVTFVSIGAGQVDFLHNSISSSTGTRFVNTVTTINTSLAAGKGFATYKYDNSGVAVWRLIRHEQGASISYTPSWSGSVTNPTIGNGTLSASYYIRGANILQVVDITAGSTTTFGSGFWVVGTAPGNAGNVVPVGPSSAFNGIAIDVVGGVNYGLTVSYTSAASGGLFATIDSTNANVDSTHPFAWANTDILRISAEFTIT